MIQFATPLMLAGAALASAPIIIHLLNKRRFRVVTWAAMEFLLASSRRNFRRVRLQEIILLVLRTLVLLLVAAAMARPFLAGAGRVLGLSQRLAVIVIDNSFSMGYTVGSDRPHERAAQFAEKILDSLNKGDSVCLIAVSERARPVIREASVDLDAVRAEIRRLPLSQGSTNLPAALAMAADMLRSSKLAQKELYLVTDNQRTAWQIRGGENSELNGILRDICSVADVILADVAFDTRENVAVTSLEPLDRIIGKGKADTAFDARVANFGETDQENIEASFFVDGFRQGSTSVSVKAGADADVSFSYTFHDAVAHSLSVKLKADRLAADDERFLAVDVLESAKVLLVEGKPAQDLYESATGYLQTALSPKADAAFQRSTVYEPVVLQPADLAREPLDKYEFVVLADVDRIDANVAASLEAYVRAGGSVVIFPGDALDQDNYNTVLFQEGNGLLPAKFAGIRGDPDRSTFTSLAVSPENTHALLKEFRQTKSAFLNLPQVFRYAALEPPQRDDTTVICSFEQGAPALVEKAFGRGRVLQFAFTANDAWTDLPRRPGYLLLMQEVASYVARDRQKGKNLLVGDTVLRDVGPEALVSKITLATPGGSVNLAPTPEANRARLKFENTGAAGVYELKMERDGTTLQDVFTVNVDPAESDLHHIGPEQLRRVFPDFRFRYLTAASGLETSLKDTLAKSDLWKQLLLAALVLMCIESILAQRFGR